MHLPPPGVGKLPVKPEAAALPDDVVAEILIRLPARSVCRFRVVCKGWRTLASNPSLLRAHADRAAPVPAVLSSRLGSRARPDRGANVDVIHFNFFRDVNDAGDLDLRQSLRALSLDFSRRAFSVFVGSWDGVLCVEIRRRDRSRSLAVDSYVLFNPLTRSYAVVAAPAPARHGVIIGAFSHRDTGVFHLLHTCLDEEGHISSRILKVGDPAWRELPAPTDTAMAKTLLQLYNRLDGMNTTAFWYSTTSHWLQPRGHSSVALHGNLHWVHQPCLCQYQLLVFDALAEEFRTMGLPKIDNVRMQRIREASGKLWYIALPHSMTKVETWVLEDYHGKPEWQLKRRIDTPVLENWYTLWPWMRAIDVVGDVGGDDEEIILHNNADKVTVYNVRLQSWRDTKLDRSGRVRMHRESLVPGEIVFGAAARSRLLPEACPGAPLLLSTVQDVAFASCPAARLADVGKSPRACVISSWWCASYRLFVVSSGIIRRMVRGSCYDPSPAPLF